MLHFTFIIFLILSNNLHATVPQHSDDCDDDTEIEVSTTKSSKPKKMIQRLSGKKWFLLTIPAALLTLLCVNSLKTKQTQPEAPTANSNDNHLKGIGAATAKQDKEKTQSLSTNHYQDQAKSNNHQTPPNQENKAPKPGKKYLWNDNLAIATKQAGLNIDAQLNKKCGQIPNPSAFIERAGSVLVTKINGEWYTIMGLDGINPPTIPGLPNHMSVPAGGVDKAPQERTYDNLINTMARETHEETGGYLNIPLETVEQLPCIINTHRRRNDYDRKALAVVAIDPSELEALNKTCISAYNNPSANYAYREVYGYTLVKISDLEMANKRLDQECKTNPNAKAACTISINTPSQKTSFETTKFGEHTINIYDGMQVKCATSYFRCMMYNNGQCLRDALAIYDAHLP